jgi:hypothetical protein
MTFKTFLNEKRIEEATKSPLPPIQIQNKANDMTSLYINKISKLIRDNEMDPKTEKKMLKDIDRSLRGAFKTFLGSHGYR